MPKNIDLKLKRVRELLLELDLDGIIFSEQKNLSWLTSSRFFVNLATEKAIASIMITKTSTILISNNIEADRLVEEETGNIFDHIEVYPWYQPDQIQDIIRKYTDVKRVQYDYELEVQMKELRTILTNLEIDQIKLLGREVAEAVEEAAWQIQIGDTEHQIAARLSANCRKQGIEPIVNLVAVDNRVFQRRHPLPTDLKLEKYAMLVICGRKKGQIVSVTRQVHFGELTDELAKRHQAIAMIDAQLIIHTRPGVSFKELFSALKNAYESTEFAEEWKYHHQGGLSGFMSREQLLLPGVDRQVKLNQVYAWNPSIAGVKSEDTILVGKNNNYILTQTNQFPTIKVNINGETIERPDILIRKK